MSDYPNVIQVINYGTEELPERDQRLLTNFFAPLGKVHFSRSLSIEPAAIQLRVDAVDAYLTGTVGLDPEDWVQAGLRIELGDGQIRIYIRSMTNHLLRDMLTGLTLSLDRDDQLDHFEELRHYLFDKDAVPGLLHQAIPMAMDMAKNGQGGQYTTHPKRPPDASDE